MTGKRGVARALAIGGLAAVALMAPALVEAAPPASAAAVPYTDPNANGYIGLCDQSGQQITRGRVDTAPFVWRAVSSVPAPASYNGTGRTAALLGYLAMKALPPGDWSGELLTSSTRYSNPQAPTAEATGRDESLAVLVADFPPQWDGYYELRIYLGAPNRETYQVNYPVLNIQVKGDDWQAVGGGPVNCRASNAESVESILLPRSETTPTTAHQQVTASPTTAAAQSAGLIPAGVRGGGHPGATGGGVSNGAAAVRQQQAGAPIVHQGGASGTSKGGSGPTTGVVAGLAAAAIAVAAGGYVVLRRRHRTPSSPAEPSITS